MTVYEAQTRLVDALCAMEQADAALTGATRARAAAYAQQAPNILHFESAVTRARWATEQARAACDKARASLASSA